MATYIPKDKLEEAKRDLEAFLHSVKELISEIADDPKLYKKLFMAQYHEDFKAAWDELLKGRYFSDLSVKLTNATSSTLYYAGLYGAQLKLKLKIVNDRLTAWKNGEKVKAIIHKLLEAIDVTLDSILDALGMKSALKELKDALLTQI